MKKITPYFLLLSLLSCGIATLADDSVLPDPFGPNCESCGSTLFMLRPQGLNSAAFYNPFYFGCCDSSLDTSFTFNLGYRFEQTMKGDRIARCLFGSDILFFAGRSATQDPDISYMQAENFNLSPNFLGSITFDPVIQNHNLDFMSRFEFGSVWDHLEGVYCMANATLTSSRWNLRATQTVDTVADISTMPPCLNSMGVIQAFSDIETALQQTTSFGALKSGPAKYGRFVFNEAQTKTALANIDLILGYDFIKCDGYHFGVFLKTVAPTGNRPDPETVFAPIVGNGHHWEFGGGADGHWDVWTCDDQCITAYIYGSVTHLFDDKQWRTFKIYDPTTQTACCMGQYSLLKQYSNMHVPVFENALIRGTDFTTRHVNTSFDVQGDASLRFVYRTDGWALGIGYNVYGRSGEDIQLLDDTVGAPGIDDKQYGMAGDTGVCSNCVQSSTIVGDVSLGATQTACLFDAAAMITQSIDNNTTPPTPVTGCPGGSQAQTWYGAAATTANPAILNPATNILYKGVPRQVTNKIFGHIDYQWPDSDLMPFFGVGGEVEFPFTGECYVCSASQWGVWLHGGLIF